MRRPSAADPSTSRHPCRLTHEIKVFPRPQGLAVTVSHRERLLPSRATHARFRVRRMWTLTGDSTPPESVAHRFTGILRAPRVNDEAPALPIEAPRAACPLRVSRLRRRDACDRQMPFTLGLRAPTHRAVIDRRRRFSRLETDVPGVSRRPARFGDPLARPAGRVLPRVRRESSDPPLTPLSPLR